MFLPYHLMDAILRKLPIKSLARFRLVCKAWRDLISHRDLQNPEVDLSFFLVQAEDGLDFELATFDGWDLLRTKLVKRPEVSAQHNLRFLGSCVGIVCLGNRMYADPICILNPITDEYLHLPKNKFASSNTITSGFGMSFMTKQYKVVGIRRHSGSDVYVEVCTIGSDCWRNIGYGAPATYNYLHDGNGRAYFGTFLDNFLHWIVYDTSENCWLICAFHLENETFHSLSLPKEMQHRRNYSPQNLMVYGALELGTLRGCLVAFDYIISSTTAASMWVMKEYGIEKSWTKNLVIQAAELLLVGLRFSGYRWFSWIKMIAIGYPFDKLKILAQKKICRKKLKLLDPSKSICGMVAYVPTFASPRDCMIKPSHIF